MDKKLVRFRFLVVFASVFFVLAGIQSAGAANNQRPKMPSADVSVKPNSVLMGGKVTLTTTIKNMPAGSLVQLDLTSYDTKGCGSVVLNINTKAAGITDWVASTTPGSYGVLATPVNADGSPLSGGFVGGCRHFTIKAPKAVPLPTANVSMKPNSVVVGGKVAFTTSVKNAPSDSRIELDLTTYTTKGCESVISNISKDIPGTVSWVASTTPGRYGILATLLAGSTQTTGKCLPLTVRAPRNSR